MSFSAVLVISILAIIAVCAMRPLRTWGRPGQISRLMIAGAIAALGVIGLLHFSDGLEGAASQIFERFSLIHFLLVGNTALALAMVIRRVPGGHVESRPPGAGWRQRIQMFPRIELSERFKDEAIHQ